MASSIAKRGRGPRGHPVTTSSAKKRRQLRGNALKRQCKIYIGNQITRWQDLKDELGLSNPDLAAELIDSYHRTRSHEVLPEQALPPVNEPSSSRTIRHSASPHIIEQLYELSSTSSVSSGHGRKNVPKQPTSSTPAGQQLTASTFKMSEMSEEMSSIVSTDQGDMLMSGVEEMQDKEHQTETEPTTSASGRMGRGKKSTISESFVDPFDVSIDETIDPTDDYDHIDLSYYDGDPDYEPSFNITIQSHGIDMEDFPSDHSEFDDRSDEDTSPNIQEQGESGVTRVRSEADVNRLIEEDFYLISLGQLLLLAKAELKSTCSNSDCKGMLAISTNTVGSALYLSWVCPSGHVEYKWCSQPLLKRRLHSGDLLTSASILMSGNNYSKIALFAKMLRLKIVSSSTFFKIQRHYLVPCVDEYWLSHQQEILTKYQDKEIVILGDGRMDSPGYCAQYCTYTIMENESKDILEIVTINKRQTDKKSTIMERAAFQEGLNQLRDKGLQIKEAVTDAHTQIAYLMKTTYPGIPHSFDIWHAAKNLGKKITKAGQQKNCKALQKWSRHIRNHFWYCCQKASTYEEFLDFGVV